MNMMKSEDCISSCSSNGVKQLPIGYRFCPTDEELLLHYLTNKAFSLPLPASVIPDFDVFHTLPWNLPGVVGVGGSREKGYFFCNRKNLNLNLNVNVNVHGKIGGGRGYYWKQTGKDRQIVASSGTNHVVGTRKALVFCQPKRRRSSSDTRWVMHELRLLGVSATPHSHPLFQMGWADWGVYRVFQRKKKLKRKGSVVVEESNKPSFIDFTNEASSPPPCSPCFSEGSDN